MVHKPPHSSPTGAPDPHLEQRCLSASSSSWHMVFYSDNFYPKVSTHLAAILLATWFNFYGVFFVCFIQRNVQKKGCSDDGNCMICLPSSGLIEALQLWYTTSNRSFVRSDPQGFNYSLTLPGKRKYSNSQ